MPRTAASAKLAACEKWIQTKSDSKAEHFLMSMVEVLLPRVALIEPQQALDSVAQIRSAHPDTIDESLLLRKIIGGLSCQKNPSEEHWRIFIAALSRITESGPLGEALLDMLLASRRLRFDERKRPVCQTIAALAFGPREFVLNNIEAVIWAAIAAEPAIRNELAGLGDRVEQLLALDLAG
jgi:hypothetical protein